MKPSRDKLQADLTAAVRAEQAARRRYAELAAKVEALGEADRAHALATRARVIAEEALRKYDEDEAAATVRARRVDVMHINPVPAVAGRLNGKRRGAG